MGRRCRDKVSPLWKEAVMFVGMDLHHSRTQVAVLDVNSNELTNRNLVNSSEQFVELIASFLLPGSEQGA